MTDATQGTASGDARPEDPLARAKSRVTDAPRDRSIVDEFLAERRAEAF